MNCELGAMDEGEGKEKEILEDLAIDLRSTLKLKLQFSSM